MNLTDTIPSSSSPIGRRRHILRRRLGVAILGAALLSTAACGTETTTAAAHTSDPRPATTTTIVAPHASPTASSTAATSSATSTSTSSVSVTSTSNIASSSTSTPSTSATTAPRPTATLDELVGVDGVRLHVRCIGSGDTTVLLIAGFEVGDENWGNVETDLAARARVCSYARPGTGTSDPAGSTQTFTTQATQLNRLLTTIGEPGPYVIVGHSFGGAEAITFASLFPEQVAGIVLIDSSPASWPTELCAVTDDGSEMAALVGTTCGGWTDPTANVEHLDVFASFAEVATITSLGSVPMTVITAVDRQFSDLGATELARLTDGWNQGQQQWSALSTASLVIPVENTSHHIELDRPDVVIAAVIDRLP